MAKFLKRYRYPYLFIMPFFILFLVFQLVPNLWTVYISLTEWNGIGEPRFTGAPTSSTYSRMRAPTMGGFGNEVAALSRYTVCIAVPPGALFFSV